MNLEKIESIKFALMKKEKDVDQHKADFVIYASVSFKMPKNTDVTQELFEEFVESMYDDLTKNKKDFQKDSLGIWVDYDGKKYENAMSIDTLELIKNHGAKNIRPIWEFFKMTLQNA